jgi:hypothetical protein
VGTQTRKLAELRAKTDHQLLNLLQVQLERGLEYARLMEEAHAAGQPAKAGEWYALVQETYCEANRLAQLMARQSDPWQRVSEDYERLRAYVEPTAQAACF